MTTLLATNRELFYKELHTPEKLSQLDRDMLIPGVVEPYWEVLHENEKSPMFDVYQRGPLIVRIGKLTSFGVHDLAEIVNSGYMTYLMGQTFGDFNPSSQQVEEAALHARMLSGFHKNQTFVSVVDGKSGIVVGGSIVNPGKQDRLLVDSVGKADSGLPTFYSLCFDVGELSAVNERDCVCYSRFWRLPESMMQKIIGNADTLSRYTSQVVREILGGLGPASLRLQQSLGRTYKVGWFDTTDRNVVSTNVNYYGAKVMDESPTATDYVMNSPLKLHFRLPSVVGFFPAQDQLEHAKQNDQALGPKNTLYWSL